MTKRSKESLDEQFILFGAGKIKPQLQLKKPGFKYYHLEGLHVPLRMSENLESGTFHYNKINYTAQAKAYLKISRMFFNVLKRHKIYDNSMIIIVGGHGSGRSDDMYVNPQFDHHNEALNKKATWNNFQLDKARGVPLVLVKKLKQRGQLKSHRPPFLQSIFQLQLCQS